MSFLPVLILSTRADGLDDVIFWWGILYIIFIPEYFHTCSIWFSVYSVPKKKKKSISVVVFYSAMGETLKLCLLSAGKEWFPRYHRLKQQLFFSFFVLC